MVGRAFDRCRRPGLPIRCSVNLSWQVRRRSFPFLLLTPLSLCIHTSPLTLLKARQAGLCSLASSMSAQPHSTRSAYTQQHGSDGSASCTPPSHTSEFVFKVQDDNGTVKASDVAAVAVHVSVCVCVCSSGVLLLLRIRFCCVVACLCLLQHQPSSIPRSLHTNGSLHARTHLQLYVARATIAAAAESRSALCSTACPVYSTRRRALITLRTHRSHPPTTASPPASSKRGPSHRISADRHLERVLRFRQPPTRRPARRRAARLALRSRLRLRASPSHRCA